MVVLSPSSSLPFLFRGVFSPRPRYDCTRCTRCTRCYRPSTWTTDPPWPPSERGYGAMYGAGRGTVNWIRRWPWLRSEPDWLLADARTSGGGAPHRVAPPAAPQRYPQRGNFPASSPDLRLPLFIDTYSRVTFSRAGAGWDHSHARLEVWRLR